MLNEKIKNNGMNGTYRVGRVFSDKMGIVDCNIKVALLGVT